MTHREIYEILIWILFVGMALVVAYYIYWTTRRK